MLKVGFNADLIKFTENFVKPTFYISFEEHCFSRFKPIAVCLSPAKQSDWTWSKLVHQDT